MMHIHEFFAGANTALREVNTFGTKKNITNLLTADHLGFRCASHKEYESMRTLLEKQATFIFQSIISRRRISVIRLHTPIQTALGNIFFIELADQKQDKSQKSGFDHIECYPTQVSLESCITQLQSNGIHLIKKERPHHTTFDYSLPSGFKFKIEKEPLIQKIIQEISNI